MTISFFELKDLKNDDKDKDQMDIDFLPCFVRLLVGRNFER